MERIDWLERASIERLKDRAANADIIRKECNTLVALCVAGGGAALVVAARGDQFMLAAIMTSLWLFGIAILLAVKSLFFVNYPAVWNTAKNLDQPFELDQLRHYEIENIENRDREAYYINSARTAWYNRCVILVCLTPVFSVSVFWMAAALLPF